MIFFPHSKWTGSRGKVTHGNNQISINVADLDLAAFSRKSSKKHLEIKSKPAG
jgi:hypothetical protein